MRAKATDIRRADAARRAARTGDLVLGGVLAMALLIACLAWEAMSGAGLPGVENALSGEPEVSSPVRPAD